MGSIIKTADSRGTEAQAGWAQAMIAIKPLWVMTMAMSGSAIKEGLCYPKPTFYPVDSQNVVSVNHFLKAHQHQRAWTSDKLFICVRDAAEMIGQLLNEPSDNDLMDKISHKPNLISPTTPIGIER